MMEVKNMPLEIPTNLTIGSITTTLAEPPQGQVLKLDVTTARVQPEEQEKKTPPPLFGAHIREGIAVVKDWVKKP